MKCFLDMDGVLVDFIGGANKAHNLPDPYLDPANHGVYDTQKLWGLTAKEFWEPTNSMEFWLGLEKTPEADAIADMVCRKFGSKNVAILTAPSPFLACAGAKRLWIEKHFPQFKKRIILASAGAKQFLAAPDKILVDDRDSNIEEFMEGKGLGILVPRLWNKNYRWSDLVTNTVYNALEGI